MKRGLNKENSLPDPEFGRESSESARAIHYVVQKDTLMTYVSALGAQADPGIVSGSTIERKIMSTKTIYKRIALVAVASLGAGLLSVAPANAVAAAITPFGVTASTYAPADSFAATVAVQQVAGALNYVEFDADYDQSAVVAKVTGSTIISQVQAAGTSPAVGTLNTAATEITWSNSNLEDTTDASFRVGTPTVGTITVVIATRAVSNGVVTDTTLQTFTITVAATASVGTLSVANSTSLLSAASVPGSAWSAVTVDDVVTKAKAQGTAAGIAKLTLNDVNGTVMGATTVKAVVTGPGLVALNSTIGSTTASAAGRDVSGATSSGVIYAAFYADGTEGTSVITFSVGTTVVATETVTYYGDPTKYTATTQMVAFAGATASTNAVLVCATDKAGIAVPGHTMYAFSGDTTVATVETSVATVSSAVSAGGTTYANHVPATAIGCEGFNVTGLAQTTKSSVVITIGNASTLAASTVTTTATVNVGLALADSVVLTANKATYLPGEAMTLTLTFKDANARLVAYGAGTATLAGELVSSVSTVGTKFAADNIARLGTTTATAYAPLTSGPLVISGTTNASAGSYLTATNVSKPVTVTVTVSDSATMSALTTLINSLIAKINALNKLVIKIQKKVKA